MATYLECSEPDIITRHRGAKSGGPRLRRLHICHMLILAGSSKAGYTDSDGGCEFALMMDEEEYFRRHEAELGMPASLDAGKKHYEYNMRAAQLRLQSDVFMTALIDQLQNAAVSYAGNRPHLLYYPGRPSDMTVFVKPWESVKSKIYRINYLNNNNYPEKPKDSELITFLNMYGHSKMNDLLRARITCKYMDGPQAVVNSLKEFCDFRSLSFNQYAMNNDAGYYARHCYIGIAVELMISDRVEERSIPFELQITTQLAEAITVLTHELYEGSRMSRQVRGEGEWKWKPETQRFRSAYLGHSLHLLEGLIQIFRDEVLGLNASSPSQGEADLHSTQESDNDH